MKERFSVTQNPDGSMEFSFSNGSLTLLAETGCYVLSTGCGSGKTESIKSLIRQKHNDGILYCVDTILSLKSMYEWIKTELVDSGIILSSDVMYISSENTPESSTAYERYKNNPEILLTKKIILITHYRFWTDLINYFLVYSASSLSAFDGDFEKLLGRNDLRKWVIFDETPTFIQPFFEMRRSVLGVFSKRVCKEWRCKDHSELLMSYNEFLKDTTEDPFKTDTELDRIKKEVALSLIPQYFKSWLGYKDRRGSVSITFTPSMLVKKNVNTHILILEGAGNVLLKSSKFKFLTVHGKYYNANLSFHKFDYKNTRKNRSIVETCDAIEKIIRNRTLIEKNGKFLVVIWKSIGEGANDNGSGDSIHVEKVKEELLKRGIQPHNFEITYYGANDTKSVNKFNGFENIILVGKWKLPNSQVSEFNVNWGTSISSLYYNLWYFVQLITRIGIRNHRGGDFHVYYSEDYQESFVKALENYFDSNALSVSSSVKRTWKELMDQKKVDERLKKKISKIVAVKPELADKIESKGLEEFSIKTKELHSILKDMAKPDASKYRRGVGKALEKLGVTLNLTK